MACVRGVAKPTEWQGSGESVECSGPHRRRIFEIDIGYRMGLSLF